MHWLSVLLLKKSTAARHSAISAYMQMQHVAQDYIRNQAYLSSALRTAAQVR